MNHNPVSAPQPPPPPPPPDFTASQIDIVEQLLLVGKDQTKKIDKSQSYKANVAQPNKNNDSYSTAQKKIISDNPPKSANTKNYVISLSGMEPGERATLNSIIANIQASMKSSSSSSSNSTSSSSSSSSSSSLSSSCDYHIEIVQEKDESFPVTHLIVIFYLN